MTDNVTNQKIPPFATGAIATYRDRILSGDLAKRISTGIPELDNLIGGGLISALYVLMSTPGAGKTTLMHQMMDNVIKAGHIAIIVDLDIGPELSFCKALSRHSNYVMGNDYALSTKEVMELSRANGGEITLLTLFDEYSSTADKLVVVEAEHLTSPDSLMAITKHFCKEGEPTPVLFVDYLQFYARFFSEENDKRAVDAAIKSIQRVVKELQVPVVLISSVNRDSYNKKHLTLGSAKESGSIEYDGDYVIAMLTKDEKETCSDLRKVNLELLKGRICPNATIELTMDGAHNIFYGEVQNVQSNRKWL